MRPQRIKWLGGCVFTAALVISTPSLAQLYTPDKLFVFPYATEQNPGSTLTVTGDPTPPDAPPGDFFAVTPIPPAFVMEETNIFGPLSGFSRNSHLAFFTRASETGANAFGHKFQRSEAWDISYDMKIETPHPTPRKEAGFFFQSPIGDGMFIATSNAGHFVDGPGEITTVFQNVIPTKSFSSSGLLLGDYNHNGRIDGPDYIIWRDTFGSTTDFRANGTNEGDSNNKIDEADYAVWRAGFGSSAAGGIPYGVGDTINMRMVYTPPVTDPLIPFDVLNPSANVITGGTMEYLIRINGGTVHTSGPLEWTYAANAQAAIKWMGIPNDTLISIRSQNLSVANVAPDSAKVTFSNFDYDGPSPGAGLATGVPEPATGLLAGLGCLFLAAVRRARSIR
jgi:hypothetical protein